MISLHTGFFAQQNFIPHGFCLAWDPALLSLHVSSDSVIAIAYYTIPFALIYFISRRRDLAFRGLFALTGAFILACGTTHLMAVVTLWYPDYWLDGMIKFVTALVSIFTAAAMWWAMPHALALPSTAQLQDANRRLQHEIGQRERAEAALRDANEELERRVAARTAELEDEVGQRRRTEEILRSSEHRWRSMFEASAVGIALTDEYRRFVAANKAFQRMMGYTEEELCRLGPIEITYEDDREATRERLDDMRSGGFSDYQVEKRYRRKDGSVIWVRVSTARSPEPGSSLRGLPTIIEDVTERKRAEDALRHAQADLERAGRLTTMGELAASIAHEVNQPLMAVVTNADTCLSWLTRDKPDLDEAKRATERIIRAGHRAGDIVRTIHALARKSLPEMKPFDVNGAISDVLALVSSELRRHDVSLRTELSTDVEPVLGNRGQLQQVLLNLTVNAIEAMSTVPDRPRMLRVSSQMDRSVGVLIAVADTGGGLDSTEIDRIFDAFFTTKPEGMGMGLSICRSIVEAHGGRLWVSSNPPSGSVFQFTLPPAGGGIGNNVAG